MGEEQKMAFGTLWVATEGGEPVKLCNFGEVETYSDEKNDDYRAILYSHEDISAPIEASFTISPHIWRGLRKHFGGFGRCKGPARRRAIMKWVKLYRKSSLIVESYLKMYADLDYISVNETYVYPVDVTGLPCTDIWEYLWFRKAIVENATEYANYRGEKLRKTARSRRRSQRR